MKMRRRRVTYETYFRQSTAAKSRVTTALIQCQGLFDGQKTQCFDDASDLTCLIKLHPSYEREFKEIAKVELSYKSPIRFDTESECIQAIYDSPYQELKARDVAEENGLLHGEDEP